MGARVLGMGQVGTALPDNPWAIYANPALLSYEEAQFGFYGLRNYGLPELTDKSFVVSYPAQAVVLASGIHRYGDELFTETRMLLGISATWEGLSVGMSVNYHHLKFGGAYGTVNAWDMDAGLAFPVNEQLWLGASTTNLLRARYPNDEEELPQQLAVGYSYLMNKSLVLSMDLIKDVQFPLSVRAGLEAEMITGFFGRTGVSTQPLTYSLGFGYRKHNWETNIAFQQHEYLGGSPGLDLIFKL